MWLGLMERMGEGGRQREMWNTEGGGTQEEEKLRDGGGGSQRQAEIRSCGALCMSGWGEDFLEFIQRAIRSF